VQQELFQRFCEIVDQMPAVRDLDRLRRTSRDPVGIQATAVARRDFDQGMRFEPCGDSVRGSVREQIDHPVPLQVADNTAVALAALVRPVVHADDARRARIGQGAARINRSKESGLVGIPRRPANRKPASPPRAKPTCARVCRKG